MSRSKPVASPRRRRRGRPRKVYGQLYEGPRGKPVRLATFKVKREHLVKPTPRGKTGKAFVFTSVLKELSPLVYAFIVDQLSRPERKRDPMVQPIIAEYRRVSSLRHQRPSSREFGAFVIERAMNDAWPIWGIKPPYSEGEVDSFLRRYVHGHHRALRDYRKALQLPERGPQGHIGDWLKYFFGRRGEAAREFKLLTTEQEPFTLVTLFEEEDPQRSR